LDPQVLDEASFQLLCPHADDVWLYMMARKAGSLYRQVGGGFNNTVWPDSQQQSLLSFNVNGGNDAQIKAVEEFLMARRFSPAPFEPQMIRQRPFPEPPRS
jgi:hypothetical protein